MIGYAPHSYLFSWTSYIFSKVHVAVASYSELPSHVLEQILSIRKAAFIDRRKWHIASYCGSEYEFDEYDDDDALYLYTHKGVQVTGCVRLRPSYKPTLICGALNFVLSDDRSRPNLIDCWEASRFALLNSDTSDSGFTEAKVDLRTVALFLAMLQFASTQEIGTYEVIVDALMEKVLKRSGWTVARRNVVQGSKGEKVIYGTLECTPAIYHRILRINHVQRLTERPPPMAALRTFDDGALRSPSPSQLMTSTH
ncbi:MULTISPECIES: acyl-homoserine-lactone synthase [Pseudomonas]|uniref:Acyl-homoserine-lactone synthase n=1 Tax=Pseudomonas asplenii TaxID=53407 RepID=A0A0N0VI87_9PSED|nr:MULTISPECIES: acyl-homoserine-lactone synthase [Pseudomonas]KPA87586.1 N-acyl-L-homoserine lactone synthetase [Pseudomonas fuscovaginae]